MKISEILKNKSTISFEVFPPKNKEGDISSIYSTATARTFFSPSKGTRMPSIIIIPFAMA